MNKKFLETEELNKRGKENESAAQNESVELTDEELSRVVGGVRTAEPKTSRFGIDA